MTQGTTGARASAAAYPILTLTTLLWAGNTVAGKWAVGEVSPQVLRPADELLVRARVRNTGDLPLDPSFPYSDPAPFPSAWRPA